MRLPTYAISAFLLIGCNANTSDWQPTIADGSYSVTGPLCSSTNAEPEYREPVQKIVLFAFAELDLNKAVVSGRSVLRVFRDEDCELTASEDVFRNTENRFSTRLNRRYEFVPEACQLAIELAGEVFTVGVTSTDFFGEKVDFREDITFDVETNSGGAYVLSTEDHPDLSRIWEEFGCPANDRLMYLWDKEPSS